MRTAQLIASLPDVFTPLVLRPYLLVMSAECTMRGARIATQKKNFLRVSFPKSIVHFHRASFSVLVGLAHFFFRASIR